jgi:hypothetical protein
MKIAFNIPQTPLVRVEYVKGRVAYHAIIKRPQDNVALFAAMLTRQVNAAMIRRVTEHKPNVMKQS